jgi:hypothetical protein
MRERGIAWVPRYFPGLACAITRSRPLRGGHLWAHVWALTDTVPLARRAGDPRALAWHNEALTTAQRSGCAH